jgi:hypothetical protein
MGWCQMPISCEVLFMVPPQDITLLEENIDKDEIWPWSNVEQFNHI